MSPWGQGPVGGMADSFHNHTHFAKLHAIDAATNIVTMRNIAGGATTAMADHQWSQQEERMGQGMHTRVLG